MSPFSRMSPFSPLLQANPDPNATPASASFTLSLLDNRAPDPLDIQIGNTIEGDQAPLRDANNNIQHDQWGNIIPTGPEPGRADTINDTPANDRINAGVGDDEFFCEGGAVNDPEWRWAA